MKRLLTALLLLASPAARAAGPVVVVRADFAAATAAEVAESVAAPIEQQVRGLEGVARMESESDTGAYSLVLRFRVGVDPGVAAVSAQQRVALAEPQLPEACRRAGVTLRRGGPEGVPRVWLALTAERNFDAKALGSIARSAIGDDLARLVGVGDIAVHGAEGGLALAGASRAVLLAVATEEPGVTRDALPGLGRGLPVGVRLTLAADAGPGTLVAEVARPGRVSDAEFVGKLLAAALQSPGEPAAVGYATPGSDAVHLLLAPTRGGPGATSAGLRKRLREVAGNASVRVSPLGADGRPFPVRLSLVGPDAAKARAWAAAVGRRAAECGAADAAVHPGPDEAATQVRPDRAKMRALGVTEAALNAALAEPAAQVLRTPVRTDKGETVPLGTFAVVAEVTRPTVVYRRDGERGYRLTAAPGGKSPESATRELLRVAGEERRKMGLSAEYRAIE